MIILNGVRKSFYYKQDKQKKTITALQDISFSVPEGEVVGIVGASGAGKTTLLKIICGLLLPEEGIVRCMGMEPVSKRKKIRDFVAVLFTGAGVLEPEASVEKNLEIAGAVYRKDRDVFLRDLKSLSEVFSLENIMGKRVKELSLGEKRRAELVYVLIQKAELYLFDEPCIGLDAQAKQVFELQIEKLKKEGKTVFISSHDIAEIDSLCDRVIMLGKGRMIYYGNKEGLYRKYAKVDALHVKLSEGIPDLEDLPVKKYEITGQEMTIYYDTDCVKTAEIVKVLLKKAVIQEMNVKRFTLEEIIALSMKEEEEYEQDD